MGCRRGGPLSPGQALMGREAGRLRPETENKVNAGCVAWLSRTGNATAGQFFLRCGISGLAESAKPVFICAIMLRGVLNAR